ncbi:hypothetical protein JJJ17_02070 [Paracoccus caeni]|uniref:Uncharacterized protein n=1 Tax=Paracoccus caeni TaxID=657651 RepID=A0A934SCA3_9RHOB|nr:hypothetical protein [Paracoccus caeni]MBK4214705.1 hypothetical protein [Paracoccus caeni]
MNLHLHGCVDVGSANELCDLGLTTPFTLRVRASDDTQLQFDALMLELSGHIEIGRMTYGAAITHRFVQDAFERMRTDQCRDQSKVVFEQAYLENCSQAVLLRNHPRAAVAWWL